MSAEQPPGGVETVSPPSRLSNGTNSTSTFQGGEPPESEIERELPTVEERIQELLRKFPERSFIPLSETNGQKLRKEVTEADTVTRTVEPDSDQDSSFEVEEVIERRSLPLVGGVETMLNWYEEYRHMYLKFGFGRSDEPTYETFQVKAENSFTPAYSKRQYAMLQAFARELVGGERPTGVETDAAYDNPAMAFITRSASGSPDGEYIPFVEHDRAIADAWGNGVYKALYDAMGRLEIEQWEYHKQGEPHAGGGANTLYGHDHTMLIMDLPPGVTVADVERELEAVIDKHVEVCDLAGVGGHIYDDCIEVRKIGDDDGAVRDVASYMAKYISFGEEDLLERPIEYIAWAAVQWSTNTQKGVRSTGANHAIAADACRQKCDDPECHQEHTHGERIARSDKRGVDFECFECGSPWGVDQSPDTLSEARLMQLEADGGVEAASGGDPGTDSDEVIVEMNLRSRWPSARSGAISGEPVKGGVVKPVDEPPNRSSDDVVRTLPDGRSVGFERLPEWELEAVIVGEEELPPSRGGVEMVPLKLPDPSSPASVSDLVRRPNTLLRCPDCELHFSTASAFVEHDCSTGEAFVEHLGYEDLELPSEPVDVVRIFESVARDVGVEPADEPVDVSVGAREVSNVVRYVEENPSASVVEVLGALRLSPERRELVESVMRGVVDE